MSTPPPPPPPALWHGSLPACKDIYRGKRCAAKQVVRHVPLFHLQSLSIIMERERRNGACSVQECEEAGRRAGVMEVS